MLGNFTYCNPTKLYFGEDSLSNLSTELKKYGQNVVLIYGGGSIKINGIYDEVMAILKEEGKNVAEIEGVMPTPTLEKLYEGVAIARNHKVDLLLAVGGGSVCDYAKAVSVSVYCVEDPWEKYYLRFEEPSCEIIPVGCVLTYGGTYSDAEGFYIDPTVIHDIKRDARIANEEIFGPVLAVIKVDSFDEALDIANQTEYGLTGSVYSETRENIQRAKIEFQVGNLYFNRKSTAAVVLQHPFGGFNMSGTDAKTGTKDYLTNFLNLKSITEDLNS
ncbi:aldehyde dehydrogenase family protein [Faecalicatena contorta]|uniref:aldehyde dehydrogenase family protein n=1 Tax=Faecalicatena contorta TaxID=39482 RepID=UPI0027E0867E|nr:aldehyde dehydrogenase family protein [Faecalicatena contorta]